MISFIEWWYKNQDKIYYNILNAKPGNEYRLAFEKEFAKCWNIAKGYDNNESRTPNTPHHPHS